MPDIKGIEHIDIDLGHRSYSIHTGSGLLEQVGKMLPPDLSGRPVFILSDEALEPHVIRLEKALADVAARIEIFSIKAGEPAKSYTQLQNVLDWLLDNGVDRKSVLFAVGGGVIGDLGGFAASVVLRGISYVQIPTTLLAQVDSSVGGKTGINTRQGKNLVGTFYQPRAVFCDSDTLATLPRRELRAGYAEIVKYGLINDTAFFGWLEANGMAVLDLDPSALAHAVATSCRAKAAVVAADEREGGQRALLNLGHTFGHALEAAAGYDGSLLHGEAVAIGMVLAFALSVRMGLCPEEDYKRMRVHLESAGLPVRIPAGLNADAEKLADLMRTDKKASGGKIGFILVNGIGKSFQTFDVNREDVVAVLRESGKGEDSA